MRVHVGSRRVRRFGVVAAAMGATLVLTTALGLASAEAVVNKKIVKVYTPSVVKSFDVIVKDKKSECVDVSSAGWHTTNIDVYVGETVWVKTWGVSCRSGAPINIDTTPQVKVPADDLTYYWVTTKQ